MAGMRNARSSLQAGFPEVVDAVIVGAGHHGLVAAALLADAGWDVVVLEANDKAGGAVASRTTQGWVQDEYSAFHPLAKASPVLTSLGLADHGLAWADATPVVTHVGSPEDVEGSVMHRDAERTAEALERDHPGDGDAWLRLHAGFERVREPLLDALLTQWPPTTSALRLVGRTGVRELPDFARMALLPLTQFSRERFGGHRGPDLVAGNAMHADIPPTAPGSALFGWIMSMLAQSVGFPTPVGGAGELASALVRRAETAGAQLRLRTRVRRVVVRAGRAAGVELDGGAIGVRRAVICDTSAPDLYGRLLGTDVVPAGLRARLDRFTWDLPTLKLNYRLSAPVPWTAAGARGAAVVHAGLSLPALTRWSADLETGVVPEEPFALLGQMTSADPSRSPAGTETLWLYTHLPLEAHGPEASGRLLEASETMLDRFAAGWRNAVLDRWAQSPADLAASDANLSEGAVGGGTSQLFQQAIWRPVTGLGGPRTFVDGLYLGSAAIHPGGGVHGGCGFLAARAALADAGWWSAPRRRLATGALRRLYERPPRY